MISRRKFLKITGLAATALGAGFSAGKLVGNKKSVYYAVYGYIPADEEIFRNIIFSFREKIKSNSKPVIQSELKIIEMLNSIDLQAQNASFGNSGKVKYNLKKLDKEIDSDIIISDSENPVYSLYEFNQSMSGIRTKLKGKKAGYFFTAEYSETDLLSSILNTKKKVLVIDNENGTAERIPLDKTYKNVDINGPFGKTVLRIEGGIARVHSASCRHKICEHSVAGSPGNIIACAPNKILVKVELV
ncbi:MAG: NusG domain II-containing protein [Ignavibacteriaceae bacterium]